MATHDHVNETLFALRCLTWEPLFKDPKFSDFSEPVFAMMIFEANKMADEVLAPVNVISDREGARYDPNTGTVVTPKGFIDVFNMYRRAAWQTASLSPKFGGMGIPSAVELACSEMFVGACSAFTMAPGLTRSAVDVLVKFGTDAQIARYVPQMVACTWTGTMCLTEPHAGSDVGSVITKANPIDGKPGWYHITGEKTFISFGEHDMAENIIHLVLARTPGAPEGTKGISLFIVPKTKLAEDGQVSHVLNDVVCAGIEHKMGIHGSPTCTLKFGETGNCEGELLGEECRGMNEMFLMMNEARLLVALQGMALGSAAYDLALAYAKERVQGVHMSEFGKTGAKKVSIIEHYDVRRMLMDMRAHTESMRALVYQIAHYIDLATCVESDKERKMYHEWVGLLTPIAKAYCSDVGFEVTSIGVQVHGGAGYCSDHRAEQYLRDARITSIYEGANGIQAQYLLKFFEKESGRIPASLVGAIGGELEKLSTDPVVGEMAKKILAHMEQFHETIMNQQDKKGKNVMLVNACAILEVFGLIASGFYLLKQAKIASDKFEAICGTETDQTARATICSDNTEAKFYFTKVETTRWFVDQLLPRAKWRIEAITSRNTSCLLNLF